MHFIPHKIFILKSGQPYTTNQISSIIVVVPEIVSATSSYFSQFNIHFVYVVANNNYQGDIML